MVRMIQKARSMNVCSTLFFNNLTEYTFERSWPPQQNLLLSYASVMQHINCKLSALSKGCCLKVGRCIGKKGHFSSLLHRLRPSKWHVERSTRRNFRPFADLHHFLSWLTWIENRIGYNESVKKLNLDRFIESWVNGSFSGSLCILSESVVRPNI